MVVCLHLRVSATSNTERKKVALHGVSFKSDFSAQVKHQEAREAGLCPVLA